MAMNNFVLGKAKEVEDGIYAMIKMKKQFHVQSMLLYDDYDSLFQLFLTHNPQKVFLHLCRQLYLGGHCYQSVRQIIFR